MDYTKDVKKPDFETRGWNSTQIILLISVIINVGLIVFIVFSINLTSKEDTSNVLPNDVVSIHEYNNVVTQLNYEQAASIIPKICLYDYVLDGELDSEFMNNIMFHESISLDSLNIAKYNQAMDATKPYIKDALDSLFNEYIMSIPFILMKPGEDSSMYINTDTYDLAMRQLISLGD